VAVSISTADHTTKRPFNSYKYSPRPTEQVGSFPGFSYTTSLSMMLLYKLVVLGDGGVGKVMSTINTLLYKAFPFVLFACFMNLNDKFSLNLLTFNRPLSQFRFVVEQSLRYSLGYTIS
jgi:hypothetical protein